MSPDLILVTLSLFTWGFGEGLFLYFQPLYLQQLGASPLGIGAILGAMGVAITLAQVPSGYLADRLGRRPVMWASWITGAAAAWIMALAGSLNLFIFGVILYGLTGFVVVPMNSYISSAHPKWPVSKALAVTSGMYNLGTVIGPLIGGRLATTSSLKVVYLAAAVVFMLSTLIVLFIRPQPIEKRRGDESQVHPLKNPRFLAYLLVVFVAMFAIYLPQPLTSNFLHDQRSLSLATIGQLGSIGNLGNALLTLAAGQLSAPLGFLLGQVSMAVFAALLWRGSGLVWYSIAYFFIGGYRAFRAMAIAQARPLVHAAELGVAYGFVETANSVATILAPLLAGVIYEQDPILIYPLTIGLIAISLVVSLQFVLKQKQDVSALVPNPGSNSE